MPSDAIVTLPPATTADLCYAFQDMAFAHLEDRVHRALDWCEGEREREAQEDKEGEGEGKDVNITACNTSMQALVVVGGVAANAHLRQRLLDLLESRSSNSCTSGTRIPLIFPPVALCTDNGVMAAWTGVETLLQARSDDPAQLEVVARWPLGSSDDVDKWRGEI